MWLFAIWLHSDLVRWFSSALSHRPWWAHLQNEVNKLIQAVSLGEQLHVEWLTSSDRCRPPDDHTRGRTALRHPFVQPGVTEGRRGRGNRSLSDDGLCQMGQTRYNSKQEQAHVCSVTYMKNQQKLPLCAPGWNRCGRLQCFAGVTHTSRALNVKTPVCINTSPGFPHEAQCSKTCTESYKQQIDKPQKPVMSACSLS